MLILHPWVYHKIHTLYYFAEQAVAAHQGYNHLSQKTNKLLLNALKI